MTLPLHLVRLDRVESTMLEIDRLARSGAPEGTLVWANQQTSGKGRGEHTWVSITGAGLEFSVLLRPDLAPRQLGGLAIEAGLSMAEAIAALCSLEINLKWPNDLLIGGRKVGGLLLRSSIRGDEVQFVNLGIGVNVLSRIEALPEIATSLAVETGKPIDRLELLSQFWSNWSIRYDRYQSLPEVDQQGFQERAVWLDQEVEVNRPPWRGRFAGIDSTGAALIGTGDQFWAVNDGSISKLPLLHS